jgi:hypothetical protein
VSTTPTLAAAADNAVNDHLNGRLTGARPGDAFAAGRDYVAVVIRTDDEAGDGWSLEGALYEAIAYAGGVYPCEDTLANRHLDEAGHVAQLVHAAWEDIDYEDREVYTSTATLWAFPRALILAAASAVSVARGEVAKAA